MDLIFINDGSIFFREPDGWSQDFFEKHLLNVSLREHRKYWWLLFLCVRAGAYTAFDSTAPELATFSPFGHKQGKRPTLGSSRPLENDSRIKKSPSLRRLYNADVDKVVSWTPGLAAFTENIILLFTIASKVALHETPVKPQHSRSFRSIDQCICFPRLTCPQRRNHQRCEILST